MPPECKTQNQVRAALLLTRIVAPLGAFFQSAAALLQAPENDVPVRILTIFGGGLKNYLIEFGHHFR